MPFRLPKKDLLFTIAAIVFCGWFLMKFHMDTANDSETQAYVGAMLASASHATLATDAQGQYTALAPYVMWPFAASLEPITGAYLIRGLVFALLTLSTLFCATTYLWFRELGLAPFARLLGLVLLTTSAAFALEIKGWEIDRLIEPILFVLAALLAVRRQWLLFVVLAALAAANAETGIFAPFVALVAPNALRRRDWAAVLIALAICAIEVVVLRQIAPPPHIPLWLDATPDQLVNIAGGLCLLPLLAMICGRHAPQSMQWLLYAVVPIWVIFVLATHRLDQGSLFLAPLALVWLPVTLLGAEHLIRASSSAPRVRAPEAPEAR